MYRTVLFVSLIFVFSNQRLHAQKFYTEIGNSFPVFETTDIHGKPFTITSLRGKPSLIIFFGTRCPPCLAELQAIHNRFPRSWYDRLNVIVIGSTDDAKNLIRFNERRKYRFRYLPDENQELFHLIGDHTIPRTFLLDRNATIISQSAGFYMTPFEYLIQNIRKELKKK